MFPDRGSKPSVGPMRRELYGCSEARLVLTGSSGFSTTYGSSAAANGRGSADQTRLINEEAMARWEPRTPAMFREDAFPPRVGPTPLATYGSLAEMAPIPSAEWDNLTTYGSTVGASGHGWVGQTSSARWERMERSGLPRPATLRERETGPPAGPAHRGICGSSAATATLRTGRSVTSTICGNTNRSQLEAVIPSIQSAGCSLSHLDERIKSGMKLRINGKEGDFSALPGDGLLSVAALVETLGMKADRVAVELNLDIVPRARWADTQLNEGDRLEIVHFVGGG